MPALRNAIAFAVALSAGGGLALRPTLARAAEPGDELTISVLTMGPGDHPFYKFGHNALWIHDAARGRDDVYNYGTFDFASPTLLRDFLGGRLLYWLSVLPLRATLAHYGAERRSILAQELRLTPGQRRALADRLEQNALPENRYYRYDYYRDNCSTRVRDAIDAVVGGRLRAASTSAASLTFRGHTERLTADDLGVYLGLDAAMGGAIDQPTTQWEEMFLPSKLSEGLRRVRVPGVEGDEPLVAREVVLLAAARPPPRVDPPRRASVLGLVGSLVGTALALLGLTGRTRRLARVAFGVVLAAMGLGLGLLGSVLAFLWLATDHVVAYRNQNILLCAPPAVVLGAAGLGVAWGKAWSERLALRVTALCAALSIGALLLKLLPWFGQTNGHLIALVLPAWLGAAAGVRGLSRAPYRGASRHVGRDGDHIVCRCRQKLRI